MPSAGSRTVDSANDVFILGVGEGVSDLHFGNNVQIQSGHAYVVRVTEGGEHAVFHFTAR